MSQGASSNPRKVIVVGAGIIGASIAYNLAKRGVSCLILEQCDIACAASGKAAGFLAKDWCDETAVRGLARPSFGMHARYEHELQEHLGYRKIEAYSASLVSKQSPTSPYHNVSRRTRKSALSWVDGDVAFIGNPSLIGPQESTAQVHPKKLTVALINAAKRISDTEVHIARVTNVVSETTEVKVTAERIDGSSVEYVAEKVALAMGPWSIEATKWFPKLPPVMAQKAASLVVKEVVPGQAIFSQFVDRRGKSSQPEVYPREDEVYLCHYALPEELPTDPKQIDADPQDVVFLKEFAASLSPKLRTAIEDVSKVRAQACNLPVSPDGLPLIGLVPGTSNVAIATAHSCWGILNSPATGKVVAELIIEGSCRTLDLSHFSPSRFS